MTAKVKCRPTRVHKKPGQKTVQVSSYKRSTPKKLIKCK